MPAYLGTADFDHHSPGAMGVLVTNLGTPDAPTPAALRRYLGEFLWDPRVIEVPRPLWWLILHGVILRLRPRRSAAAYRKVWSEEGSPLLAISRHQEAALRERLEARCTGPVKVALGMRYGNPSIADALEELRRADIRRLLVLPLYPQYAAATTASTFDAVSAVLRRWRWLPEVRFINRYPDHPGYIGALATSIREAWAGGAAPDRLLFSFHGLPRRYLDQGDPYHCECHKTARLTAEALGLEEGRWQVAFQSRVGREEWLRPYTDETVTAWGREGLGRLQVVCPGFSADCLETLEEIGGENRDYFLEAGGGEFEYIPALNDRPEHMDFLTDLVLEHTRGWAETSGSWRDDGAATAARAIALGAKA